MRGRLILPFALLFALADILRAETPWIQLRGGPTGRKGLSDPSVAVAELTRVAQGTFRPLEPGEFLELGPTAGPITGESEPGRLPGNTRTVSLSARVFSETVVIEPTMDTLTVSASAQTNASLAPYRDVPRTPASSVSPDDPTVGVARTNPSAKQKRWDEIRSGRVVRISLDQP